MTLKNNTFSLLSALILLFSMSASQAAETRTFRAGIASAHPLATQAGFEVLAAGGNAFDAAVAVSAALGVVEPFGSGLGGGGFWLLHTADGRDVFVDGRERAPLAATRDMYLDKNGDVRPRASLDGPLAAGIPGVPAALVHLAERYGRLTLAADLAPALRYAERGFPAGPAYRRMASERLAALSADPAARVFLQGGGVPKPGFRLLQPQLAQTLRRIAQQGHAGFYAGPVAQELVRSVREAGGIWTAKDLQSYRVIERRPIQFTYRGAKITAAPPPSSGGVVLAEALQILDRLPMKQADRVQRMHYTIEAMRRAYQDRARFLGDSDFVAMPMQRLLSPNYAAERARGIDPESATPSAKLSDGAAMPTQGPQTTHFSVVDDEGNRVAGTLSLNMMFGSGFVAGSTGVLLNDEMDDFASKPGVPNVYGLVGAEANSIAPGKRPLSSMSPTFVEDSRGVLVLGTPGGSRIISMVLLGILEYLDQPRPDPLLIVARPRYHHQFLPDRVQVEPASFSTNTLQALELMGHEVEVVSRRWGNMQVVFQGRDGHMLAASDPRGEGLGRVQSIRETTSAIPAAGRMLDEVDDYADQGFIE
ncbi:gamma-glutamyltransferase [Thermithiobacillus plumbiphilus]|uniref:Glutathione hydrolase proenzyme n=1 Tax=Thermithiobacillus plumbiphilus TaxID=1729899 RepID=A0ABU9D646_9PROT